MTVPGGGKGHLHLACAVCKAHVSSMLSRRLSAVVCEENIIALLGCEASSQKQLSLTQGGSTVANKEQPLLLGTARQGTGCLFPTRAWANINMERYQLDENGAFRLCDLTGSGDPSVNLRAVFPLVPCPGVHLLLIHHALHHGRPESHLQIPARAETTSEPSEAGFGSPSLLCREDASGHLQKAGKW